MFNVVIENETFSNIDPLIIKEDINNIIQSIEEQLYNINISYRNNFRKIKNNLKLLEGISESKLVILEETQISDSNLISYLTNVLEISLDCIVSTLYENKEFRPQLKYVKNIKDLVNIDSKNTKIFSNILEECKELFNAYSQVNEIQVSSTSFYELLDKSIEKSVNSNINTNVPEDVKSELEIYNKVIENLDNLIGSDLITTYDNIKIFAALQVKQVNEGIWDTIKAIGTVIKGTYKELTKALSLGAMTIGVFVSVKTIMNWFAKKDLSEIKFKDPEIGSIATRLFNSDKSLSVDDINKLQIYFNTSLTSESDKGEKLVLEDLLSEKREYINNIMTSQLNKVSQKLSQTNSEIVAAQASLSSTTVNLNNALEQLRIANHGTDLADKVEELEQKFKTLTNLDEMQAALKEFTAKYDEYKELDSLKKAIAQADSQLISTNSRIDILNQHISTLGNEKTEIDVAISTNQALLDGIKKEYETAKSVIEEASSMFEEYLGYSTAAVILGIAGVGLVSIVYIFVMAYIRKKTFGTRQTKNTITAILKLRKQIDELRKKTISLFPELKVQFTYLDSEVAKCERYAVRQNDFMTMYECSMKYFMGSYAVIMYSTLLQMKKDGLYLDKFRTLSEIHNYNGFASLTTRSFIKELNLFYDNMITYDATLIDAFEKVFTIVKQQVIENKLTDNISRQLPNRLTTTMVGPK